MAHPAPNQNPMTFESREARLAWERERLAEAEDDIANGRVISGDEALAWLQDEMAQAEAAMRLEAE
jgi:predicted transcriptional regulator